MHTANEIRNLGAKRKAEQRLLEALRNNEDGDVRHWINHQIPNIMSMLFKNTGHTEAITVAGQMPEAVRDAFAILGFSAYSFEQGTGNKLWYSKISW